MAGYRLAFVAEAVVYHHNEATLPGLFRQGFAHGFHGVRARKRHEHFLRRYGHGPVERTSLRADRIPSSGLGPRSGQPHSGYNAVFNSGKKAGKLLGSLRYGHLDL